MLIACAHRQIGGQTVQIDRRLDGLRRLTRVLRQQAGDQPGEQVAAAALGHAGIAGGVDGHAAIGVGDERAPALEHQRDAVALGKAARHFEPVGLHLGHREMPASRAISPGCGVSTSVRPLASLASSTGLAARILSASASITAGILVAESRPVVNLIVSGLWPRPGPMASTVFPEVSAATTGPRLSAEIEPVSVGSQRPGHQLRRDGRHQR